jgi:hypothetical protein
LIDLEQPVIVRVTLNHFANGLYVKSFLNIEIDVCVFLKTTSGNPVFKRIYAETRQFGILPSKCPVKKVFGMKKK